MSKKLRNYIFTREISKLLEIDKLAIPNILTQYRPFLISSKNGFEYEEIELDKFFTLLNSLFLNINLKDSYINLYDSENFGTIICNRDTITNIGKKIIELEIYNITIFSVDFFIRIIIGYDNHIFKNGYIECSFELPSSSKK